MINDYQTLIVTHAEGGIATLMLNRPDRLNTLSLQLRRELAAAIAELESDAATRVLILTGAGRAFSAGMDLDEWGVATEGAAAGAYDHDAAAILAGFSGPVIGAINGLAVTGGFELALACDLLVASTAARFADTHAQVGLLPGWGGSVRLARRIGLHRAKELALTGRFLAADEAQAWGLVNHVVAPEALLPACMALASQMLGGEPQTLVAYKKLLDDGAAVPLRDALALERRASIAHNTPVARADIDARLAAMRRRRKPD